ncbi:hypothetical protein [Rhodococcus pseudokoreensis]
MGNRSLGATGVDCGRTEQKARMASTEHVDRDLVDEEVAARTARIGATR